MFVAERGFRQVTVHVGNVVQRVLASCTSGADCDRTIKLLTFVQSLAMALALPIQAMAKFRQSLLRLPSLGHSVLSTTSMCTIEALLRGPIPEDDRNALFISEFITQLLDLQPSATSSDAGQLR